MEIYKMALIIWSVFVCVGLIGVVVRSLPEESLQIRHAGPVQVIRVGFCCDFDGEDGNGSQDRNREGDQRCEGDSQVVPAWREKTPCCLPVDRLLKSRRAQGCRPEGFTGLCSFLCGSSMSAITGPPNNVWCPLRAQLHNFTVKSCF